MRSFDKAIINKALVTPKERGCRNLRPEKLQTAPPQKAVSLAWVPSSCDTAVWTRLRQSTQLAELPDAPGNFSSGRVHDASFHHLFDGKVFQRVLLGPSRCLGGGEEVPGSLIRGVRGRPVRTRDSTESALDFGAPTLRPWSPES